MEATEKWVQVRVSVNSAAAGHVVFDGMFQRVNFEGKIAPKKFVSATGKEIGDLGDRFGNIVVLDEKGPHI